MSQAIQSPTATQYLDLFDNAHETLWQLEVAAMSYLDADLSESELKLALRTLLTIMRGSELYSCNPINVAALRLQLSQETEAVA